MFHSNHTSYIKSLYKNILSEASLFFDDRARHFIKHRARSIFKDYKTCQDLERVKYKIREGRKRLHRLEQANRGSHKSALKILEEVYGRRGKTRHDLLNPYLTQFQPTNNDIYPEPFVAHAPRTAPPPKLCPPLKALILQHTGKKLEPELPVPQYKPLHVGRKANLLWRHRSMLLNRVQLPLPFEAICELEHKAGASTNHPLACSTLLKGGPKWHEFYAPSLQHLRPDITIQPRSTFKRTLPLPDSPYNTIKPDLLEYLGEKDSNKKDSIEYTPREQRRLYRRLLVDIPIINLFSPADLWNEDVKYTITKSNWVPQGVTQILEDVPDQQVIQATLATHKKKKSKKSA